MYEQNVYLSILYYSIHIVYWLYVAEKKEENVDCFRSWDLHNTLRLSCTSIWWCYTSCRVPIWIPIKRSTQLAFAPLPCSTTCFRCRFIHFSFRFIIQFAGSFGLVIFYICITHKCHWHTDLLCTYMEYMEYLYMYKYMNDTVHIIL